MAFTDAALNVMVDALAAAGNTYTVSYAITTSAGRQDERSIAVLVRDR